MSQSRSAFLFVICSGLFFCGCSDPSPKTSRSDGSISEYDATRDGVAPVQDGCSAATCLDLNKSCGRWDDGCGGDLNCGQCPDGQVCNAAGQCEEEPGDPDLLFWSRFRGIQFHYLENVGWGDGSYLEGLDLDTGYQWPDDLPGWKYPVDPGASVLESTYRFFIKREHNYDPKYKEYAEVTFEDMEGPQGSPIRALLLRFKQDDYEGTDNPPSKSRVTWQSVSHLWDEDLGGWNAWDPQPGDTEYFYKEGYASWWQYYIPYGGSDYQAMWGIKTYQSDGNMPYRTQILMGYPYDENRRQWMVEGNRFVEGGGQETDWIETSREHLWNVDGGPWQFIEVSWKMDPTDGYVRLAVNGSLIVNAQHKRTLCDDCKPMGVAVWKIYGATADCYFWDVKLRLAPPESSPLHGL